MKKIMRILTLIGKFIYKIIDKIIIVPISRLVYIITEYFKNNSGKFDKILNRPVTLIYISLFFAVAVFLLVDLKVISLVETEAEILPGQAVKAIYNAEAYVVEGIPETVDITLIGRKSDLYLAKQLGDHEVMLDLTGYSVGEHKVKLTYKQTIETLDYKLDPSSVLVVIREKISTIKNVSCDLLNQDKLDPKLSVKNISLERSEVVVKGSKEMLAKVATVKALVDLNNTELKNSGSYEIDSIPLVAYDENGNVINNVEIVPEKVTVTIELESYSVEVPIKVLTTGDYTVGYAISSITSNVAKVRIYGDQSVISDISYVPVTIDVTGLKTNKTFNVTISKPAGVRYISETSASVSVTVDQETSKEINDITINNKHLGEGLKVSAKTMADASISVIVKGVESVIKNFSASDIQAYVDLTGYEAGTHSVPIILKVDDVKVQVVSTVKTIDVVITKK